MPYKIVKNFTLILLSLCICLCSLAQDEDVRWTTFQDPKAEYKLSYPSNWKLKDSEYQGWHEYIIHTTIGNTQEVGAEIYITKFPNKLDSSVESILKERNTTLKSLKDRPNFKLINSKEIVQNGKMGYCIDFTYTKSKKEQESIHSIIWMIHKGNSAYRLMYKAKSDVDDDYLTTVNDIFDSYSFMSEPPRFNTSIMKGSWDGTQTIESSGSTPKKSYHLIIIFEKYDFTDSLAETIQLTETAKAGKIDTIYRNIVTYKSDEWLMIPYTEKVDGKDCFIKLKLKYSLKDGNHYLIGNNSESSLGCYSVSLSLKKISEDIELSALRPDIMANNNTNPTNTETSVKPQSETSEDKARSVIKPNVTDNSSGAKSTNTTIRVKPKSASEEELSPVAAQLFKTVRLLSDEGNGDIVTLNISNAEKNAIAITSGLMLHEHDTLFLQEADDNPFQADIEVYDLNDDGTYEVILFKHNRMGPKMASEFTIFNKPNLTYASPQTVKFRPVLKAYGIPIVTKTKTFGFYDLVIGELGGDKVPSYIWDQTAYRFRGNVPFSDELISSYLQNAVGGATPDELGRNLLKALQTNNKQLWLNCLHPVDFRDRERCENSFRQHREAFNQLGLTQWNLVKFSRVTFTKEDPAEDPLKSGEKGYKLFTIEFTYKNMEYLGISSWMHIKTYNNGKYFVYFTSPASQDQLMRYKK